MIDNIRGALTRKFGPLPVWGWALIAGAAIFMWRTARGQYSSSVDSPATGTETGSEPSDAPDRDPISLAPGETVYDPNTGQLVGGAPEQQPPAEPVEPLRPVTLKPGQSVFNPNTGQLVTAPGPRRPRTKRKPKPKPHHKRGAKPKHPGHGKQKPHRGGTVKRPLPRKKHKPPHGHDGKPKPNNGRRRPLAKVTGLIPSRSTHARAVSRPALRQRPVATHPKSSANSRAHPKASAHPHPAPRKPAPRPSRRKRR